MEERDRLLASLTAEDRERVAQPDAGGPFYYAGYDAPFKPLFRHNEIWIALRSDAADENVLPHPKL